MGPHSDFSNRPGQRGSRLARETRPCRWHGDHDRGARARLYVMSSSSLDTAASVHVTGYVTAVHTSPGRDAPADAAADFGAASGFHLAAHAAADRRADTCIDVALNVALDRDAGIAAEVLDLTFENADLDHSRYLTLFAADLLAVNEDASIDDADRPAHAGKALAVDREFVDHCAFTPAEFLVHLLLRRSLHLSTVAEHHIIDGDQDAIEAGPALVQIPSESQTLFQKKIGV
jgi:hypothetical protein